jgi:hypothetical protein
MKNIGKLAITNRGIGLIVGVSGRGEWKTYKVLFKNKLEIMKDILVGPDVHFKSSKDTPLFKSGTTLYLRKTYDNTFLSIRLGNKKGSDWFPIGFYDIYCQDQKINLMSYVEFSNPSAFARERIESEPMNILSPQSDIIRYMLQRQAIISPDYLYNTDIINIKAWKYDRALGVLKGLFENHKKYRSTLTSKECPFCVDLEHIKPPIKGCGRCQYGDVHGICGLSGSTYQKINFNAIDLEQLRTQANKFFQVIGGKYGW